MKKSLETLDFFYLILLTSLRSPSNFSVDVIRSLQAALSKQAKKPMER